MINKPNLLSLLSGIIFSAISQNAISSSQYTEGTTTGLDGLSSFTSSPAIPLSFTPSSIEGKIVILRDQQISVKLQQANIEQQIASLQQFLAAQESLNLKWINVTNGQIPTNALDFDIGDRKKIQICRAVFQQGTHPGTVVNGGCRITYGGDVLIIPDYQILSGNNNTQWIAIKKMDQYLSIEKNQDASLWKKKLIPVQGGFENGQPLFICKAIFNKQARIGKVVSNNCNMAVGSGEIREENYQVLFGNVK